jgi:hypothetical protein
MGDGGKDLARQSRWVLRARTRTLFNPPSCMSIKDRFRVLGALRTPDDSPLGVESARMSSSLIPASRPPSRSGFPGNRAPTPERAADDARISASTPLPEANPTAPVAGGYGASTAGSIELLRQTRKFRPEAPKNGLDECRKKGNRPMRTIEFRSTGLEDVSVRSA